MRLVIFRHGDALAFSEDGTDFSRKLSQEGIDDVKISVENLKKLGFKPDFIITTPLRRALETAEIIKSFFHDAQMMISQDFTPDASPIPAVRFLDSFGDKNILIVSHMPFVSDLVYHLLGISIKFTTSSYLYLIKRGETFEIFSRYKI